ncbi:MAG: glucose-6-phosphate isomerase [Deltaproteobacteria bacterium]|nr:glucose-6-phosphate isomerase [Deltaproteobacteria bacterium]
MISVSAWGKLRELAKTPYDLTVPGALERGGRLERYVSCSKMLNLFFATERVDNEVLSALQELADELFLVRQFKGMRRGEIINKIEGVESENRQVLHTACRDLFSSDPAEPTATGQARRELEKLRDFLDELDSGSLCNQWGQPFDTMIHIGIGGSDLGPRSIYEALKPYGIKGRKVFFISNVDPDDAARVLAGVDLKTCLVNIVSKSGTTLETLTNEHLVRTLMVRSGLDPAKQCITVTGENSPMDNPEEYLRSFYMFDYIGGRYSSTSMVGVAMLGFYLGFDRVMEFLEGAAIVDYEAENADIFKNIPLMLALLGVWNHNLLGSSSLAVLPYSQALHRFSAHLQQCDMESNGKSVNRSGERVAYKTGPVIWGEPGTNGQHAFYQLLHQGTEVVPAEFIGFEESQMAVDMEVEGSTSQEKLLANLLAQVVAFAVGQDSANPNRKFDGNRPSSLLLARKLTPKVMGAILAVYEAKIVFQGFIWNINSFDQEGVQLGKVLAKRFLTAMSTSFEESDSFEKRFLSGLMNREL